MSDNLESNNTEQSIAPESIVSAPVNSNPATTEPVSVPNSMPETNPGITSFTPEEVAAPIPEMTPESVSPMESLAKKEVVTRPLLWGVVVFLFFFALVIGVVSAYRDYQDKNNPVKDAAILPTTTLPVSTTKGALDTTPVSTDTKVQADAISAEIQSIDTDIKGDILSDTSLGL